MDTVNFQWNWTESFGGLASTASDLVERMTRLPIDKVLTAGNGRIDAMDAGLVEELMAKLSPVNMNAAFVDPHADLNGTTSFDGHEVQTLPYYDVKFYVQRTAQVFPDAWERWQEWLGGELDRSEVEDGLARRMRESRLDPV